MAHLPRKYCILVIRHHGYYSFHHVQKNAIIQETPRLLFFSSCTQECYNSIVTSISSSQSHPAGMWMSWYKITVGYWIAKCDTHDLYYADHAIMRPLIKSNYYPNVVSNHDNMVTRKSNIYITITKRCSAFTYSKCKNFSLVCSVCLIQN